MIKPDILIAEDDPVLRNLYVKKFSVAGFPIRAVEDGEKALAALQERFPQVLVLDIHMPKIDGFQVLEHYPKDTRSFPVIMLTNFGDEKNRQKGEELGADDYFIKSEMTIRKLLEMVDTLLKAKQYWGQKH